MVSSLSVIVPAFNEASNLARTILAADPILRGCVSGRLEWIWVDDGSTDGTWSEMLDLAHAIPNVTPLQHKMNRGLGAAIWTGISQASAEWCTWMPADGQFDPQAFVEMLSLAGQADAVLMIRQESTRSWQRQAISFFFSAWVWIVLGIREEGYSGIFLAHRDFIQRIPLYSTTSIQNYMVVWTCRKDRCVVRRTHTAVQPRLSGQSKVANLRTILKILGDVAKLRFSLVRSARGQGPAQHPLMTRGSR